VVRTSLLPGLLKALRENRSHALPLKVFETSDVVFKDTKLERQARNERHAAAVWCNKSAGFEVVHGLLDRIMKMLEIQRIGSTDSKAITGYYIKESTGMCSSQALYSAHYPLDPTFFPGRAATIYYRFPPAKLDILTSTKVGNAAALHAKKDVEIGKLGVLHPYVLEKFEISYPCSALEFNLEPFKKEMQTV
jgi:phenylalanyl-tRNA synthetase beta chain